MAHPTSFKDNTDKYNAVLTLITNRFASRSRRTRHNTIASQYGVSVDTIDRVNREVNKMTEKEIVQLLYSQGQTLDQIARLIHKNKQTVSNLAQGARRPLKKDFPMTEIFFSQLTGGIQDQEMIDRAIHKAQTQGHGGKVSTAAPDEEKFDYVTRSQVDRNLAAAIPKVNLKKAELDPEEKAELRKEQAAKQYKFAETLIKQGVKNGAVEDSRDRDGNFVGSSIIKALTDSGVKYPRSIFKQVMGRSPNVEINTMMTQGKSIIPFKTTISHVFPEGTISKAGGLVKTPGLLEIDGKMYREDERDISSQKPILGVLGKRNEQQYEKPEQMRDPQTLTQEDATIMRLFLSNYKNQPDALGMVAQAYHIDTRDVVNLLKRYPRDKAMNRIQAAIKVEKIRSIAERYKAQPMRYRGRQ